uniref:CSON002540 protein n=1 Tax=Culicoides sonorensis TaxID=179676 RepID=A0A336MKN2_CULSO
MRTKHIKRHHLQSSSHSASTSSVSSNKHKINLKPKDLTVHQSQQHHLKSPFSDSIIDLDDELHLNEADYLNDISTDDENIPKNYSNKREEVKKSHINNNNNNLNASYTNYSNNNNNSDHYFDNNNTKIFSDSDYCTNNNTNKKSVKMGSGGQHHQYFSLRWNNYQSNMTSVFHKLLETQSFVDVTLACENHYLKAHKVVLSACSGFFQRLLLDNPCKHPTIIMPSDIAFSDLQFIIDFVYRGEIDVSEAELQIIYFNQRIFDQTLMKHNALECKPIVTLIQKYSYLELETLEALLSQMIFLSYNCVYPLIYIIIQSYHSYLYNSCYILCFGMPCHAMPACFCFALLLPKFMRHGVCMFLVYKTCYIYICVYIYIHKS